MMLSARLVTGLVLSVGLAAAAFAQISVPPPRPAGTRPAEQGPLPGSAYAMPNNYYGAHLLVGGGTGEGRKHLRWARYLVGRWGYAKTLFSDIDKRTSGPQKGWVDYVNTCYELELIPFLRLGGHMRDGQWVKPEADRPGDYYSMARAVKRVVQGLPLSNKCPLLIEIWNEPNLNVEWSGRTDADEYAAFFVQVAKAIHDIGDPRIKVLNGGLATSPEWAEKLSKAQPEFVKSFDFWSCHPYPGNRPSWINLHDKTAPARTDMLIDSYLMELDVLRRHGARDVRVMITETGYDLGNSVYTRGEGHPIIDEYNRADYMVRAFRDFYPKWPEVVAVFPFEFSNAGWERFDWVYPDSGINEDGSPTRPHYQYTAVAALAKPTDTTGAINGTIKVAGLDVRMEGVVALGAMRRSVSDPMGNYFLAKIPPGSYRIELKKPGFQPVVKLLQVAAGRNTVFDVQMQATQQETVSGLVRSGDDDKPLSNVTVRLEPGGQSGRTDRAGQYMIKGVIPARYKLIAESRGHCRYEAGSVEVMAGRNNTWNFVLGQEARGLPENNLMNNPGMEAGGGGGAKKGLALGFEPYSDQGGREENTDIEERIVHTGRRSQAVRVRPEETAVRQITHYSTANPGQHYVAGVWIRTDMPDRGTAAWMTLDFTDNGGGVIKRFDPREKIQGRSKGWQWVSVEGVAPPKSQRISLSFHTQGQGGKAYFDDAFLGQVVQRK